MKIIVVGAGLVGTAVARALATRGTDVVVIERGVPGAEASFAAGGILSPQVECEHDGPFLRLCLQGLAATERLIAELGEHGHDVGVVRGGTLDIAIDDVEAEAIATRVAWQKAAGLTAALLDGAAVKARFPALGDVVAAAHFPTESALEPRLLFAGLRADAVRAGAVVRSGHRVVRVTARTVEVVANDVSGGGAVEVIEGDAVVVCAGAWTPQVSGSDVPVTAVMPIRGQMIEVQGAAGAFDAVVYGRGGYVVPRVDGRVVAGSTMERVGYEKTITVSGLHRICATITGLVPALQNAAVTSTWTGLRPGTSDGLPLLGQQPSGVWIASGHFRNGVLLAAVSGELLTAAILDDVAAPAAFSPARFAS